MGFTLVQRLFLCLTLLFSLSLSAPTLHSTDRQPTGSSISNLTAFEHDLEGSLTKRDSTLYNLWKDTPNSQKVTGNSAKYHKWDRSREEAYGVTYLYGCLAILISDPDFCIVAHLTEEGNGKCQLGDARAVRSFIDKQLALATDSTMASVNTQIRVLYGQNQPGNPGAGLKSIKDFLFDDFNSEGDMPESSYTERVYFGSSGTGEPTVGNPEGLALVQWVPGSGGGPDGNVKAYFGSDTPFRDDYFAY